MRREISKEAIIPGLRREAHPRCAIAHRGMTGCWRPRNDEAYLDLVRLAAGQHRGDVAFEHLLDQVEGVDDLPDLRDAAVAQRIESRDVELQHPIIAALAEEHPDMRRDLV